MGFAQRFERVLSGEVQGDIVCGDCLDVMAAMPDGCVDLVVTDPPYFQPATHYQTRSMSARSIGDLSILETWFGLVFSQLLRVLSEQGFLYSFCDGQSYPLLFCAVYNDVKAVRPLIWDKLTSINGYAWRHQHELILFAEGRDRPKIPTGDGDILKSRAVPIKERQHPAQKPLSLIERIIHKHEGLVFDPFIGSGTTAVAADRLGRNFFGCDISEKYVKMSLDSIGQDRLKRCQLPLKGI